MVAVRDRLHEFGEMTELALITFTDSASAAGYADRNQLPFSVLADADRSVFRAYALGRGLPRHIYGWRTIKRYLQVIGRRGFGDLHKATEDTLQLGGNFIIDGDGNLAYGYWSTGPADRPTVDDLVGGLP